MKIDSQFLQRLFLAFTTGLFLSCAARVSYAQPGTQAGAAVATPAQPTSR